MGSERKPARCFPRKQIRYSMKLFLKLLFGFIFVFMLTATIHTAMRVSLAEAWPSYAANPWAMATLYDAYAGFITFFVWVAYKETSFWKIALWLVLILALGNIAMSAYVLIQLFRLKADEPASRVLFRRGDPA
jgi:hypothetical protein